MSYGLHIVAAAATLLLAACGDAPAPVANADASTNVPAANPAQPAAEANPQSEFPTVVFLGDSLTAGFGLPEDAALPVQVADRLSAAGRPINAVNAGVSGDTTSNGLARYDWSVSAAGPDLVVLALGANDYLMGLSPEIAKANLAAIIEKAQASDTAIILAGIEPRSQAASGSRDAAFAALYPSLSETYDVPLFPALLAGVRDNPERLQADGLHPTVDGIGEMADRLAPFLVPHVEAASE